MVSRRARLLLKPALRRIWRDAGTLQLGVDPHGAVVLAPVAPQTARLLSALDGTLDRAGVLRAAQELGLPSRTAEQLLDVLATAGALDDGSRGRALADLPLVARERLAPDLSALSIAHRTAGAADRVLAVRRQATVAVLGAGRVGAPLSALLAAAGIGRLAIEDPATAAPPDASPGGISTDDAGVSREQAAANAVHRAAVEAHVVPRPVATPELTVLVDQPHPSELATLVREERPHLYVAVRETRAVVGPLVVPGTTACARCLHLWRVARDPAWAAVAAQISGRTTRAHEPIDVILAAQAVAQAAVQTLAFVDRAAIGGALPSAVDGTLEVGHGEWRWRRRSWAAHPDCGCQWPASRPQSA